MQSWQNSPLIEDTRTAEHPTPWRVALPVGALIVGISGVGSVLGALFNLARHVGLNNLANVSRAELQAAAFPQTAVEQMLWLISNFAGVFLLVWLWVHFKEKRPFHTVGLGGGRVFSRWGMGFLAGAVMFAAAVLLPWAAGFYERQSVPVAALGSAVVLVGWVVQGAAEEFAFRGWLLPVLAAERGVRAGILLSAGVFAAVHGLNPHLSVIAIGNLFLFGVLTALIALRAGNVWAVFGLHSAWNWMQGNVLGLSVSGLSPVGGSIISLAESGPDWLTGGAFGPEGGLAVSAVLAVGIVLAFRWKTVR